MITREQAKAALDYVIKKSRIHLYKPIQIAEILYRDRVYKDINLFIIAKTKRAEIENEMSKTSLFSLPFFSCIYWSLNNN